ncbi:hypothetical protein LOAG_02805 [Loa loa]|uniref:Uncharacterized protein n=1 Tax=Loa loa TaxID=7209 RepID=A0A1S0U5R5_LOALO|nr:hypothetical protein LOAG_02805 [Loa loa]EFO25678.1 hypothetical protein LOAG_02805 [Loa loa]
MERIEGWRDRMSGKQTLRSLVDVRNVRGKQGRYRLGVYGSVHRDTQTDSETCRDTHTVNITDNKQFVFGKIANINKRKAFTNSNFAINQPTIHPSIDCHTANVLSKFRKKTQSNAVKLCFGYDTFLCIMRLYEIFSDPCELYMSLFIRQFIYHKTFQISFD